LFAGELNSSLVQSIEGGGATFGLYQRALFLELDAN
jgi:hypothetical protein